MKNNNPTDPRIEESLERFRERFVGGKRIDPTTYEYRVFKNIEAFLQQELEACAEIARKEAVEIIEKYTSPVHPHVHSIRQLKLDSPRLKKMIDEINKK